MKKINKSIFVLFVSFFALAGCEDFLEETPESILSPTTFYISEQNVETAVNGVYDVLGERGFGVGLNFGNYNQGLLLMGHNGTDQFRSPTDNNISNRFYQLDVFAITNTSQLPLNVWTVHYIGINRANTVIENVETMLDDASFDAATLDRLKAEAHFLRAFYYFNLVRFYGDVPLKLSETASLTAEDVVGISRSPVLEVYEQIEKDLLFAEQYLLLPSELSDSENGRATKTAAWAFLARLYSTWATYPIKDSSKWALAASNAKNVIDSGEHILLDEFEDIFTLANEGNDELIFAVKSNYVTSENSAQGATSGVIGIGVNGFAEGIMASYGQLRVEQNFYASYDPTDQRRDWTISNFRQEGDGTIVPIDDANLNDPLTDQFGFAKFRRDGSYVGFAGPYDHPLFRYADVLLMYAEATANASGGPTTDSYDAINQIRRRAFRLPTDTPDASVDYSGLSLPEFNDAVLEERYFELAGEDCSRWHDLIRYEMLGDIVASKKRPSVQILFDESIHVLFPVPTTEIDANPLINQEDQNFGY